MITSFVKTKAQAIQIISSIDTTVYKIYNSADYSMQKLLSDNLPADLVNQISTMQDTSSVISFLKSAKEELLNRSELHITLAFYPTLSFINQIFAEFSQRLAALPLFDIDVQPNILGGFVLDYKGKRFDYSLSKLVDSYFGRLS